MLLLIGETLVAPIGIPDTVLDRVRPDVAANDPEWWLSSLPSPGPESHKYTRGHALIAGGAVKGFNQSNSTGVFGCHPGNPVPWVTGQTGSMFGAGNRYLKRAYDYRSVLGKLIRDHLGATQNQLNRIIPGYLDAREKLLAGGLSTIDNTQIMGEPNIV